MDHQHSMSPPPVPGWGSDLRRRGPEGEGSSPTSAYQMAASEPSRQRQGSEVLVSVEHKGITPVFGSTLPPAGVSGAIRRTAFRLSENDIRHWLLLLLADRVNVGEGVVLDLARGHVPNLFAEMGARAEWRHNKRGLARKAAIGGLVLGLCLIVRAQRRRG